MKDHDIRKAIGARLLVADGSTGGYLEAAAPWLAGRTALASLEEPALVGELHRAYFAAGADLVETATFGASERSLARLGAGDEARRANRKAAELARRAADEASARDGRPRWVAGSIGPGEEPPSFGAATWAELRESYEPQVFGLVEGGVDLFIVETCQDPLQAKAALAAIATASAATGRDLPFIVSATVDASGRLLAGTGMAAFAAIFAPWRPIALGLNCSGGPAELAAAFRELARCSPSPLSLMPNAGLPRLVGGRTIYPLGPRDFAEAVAALARETGAALVGGCCGSGPEHIAELSALLADRPAPSARPPRRPALASLFEAIPVGPGLLAIGERANAAGSAAFARLVESGDLEGQAALAMGQIEKGAKALDLHLSRAGRDEAADLAPLAGRLSVSSGAALSLDSADPEVLAAALPFVGGRPLLNSTSLERPEKARRVFRLAREFGAAVICLALDAEGPARTAERKRDICRGLYDIALAEGLTPEDLFFDPLTFSVAAAAKGFEKAAAETIRAIPLVKAACPGSMTVLGVGNVSYGLPRQVRPLVTSLFLEEARAAGLDAAICDSGALPEPSSLDPGLAAAIRVLFGADSGEEERHNAIDMLLASAGGGEGGTDAKESGGGNARSAGPGSETTGQDPASRLSGAIRRGESSRAAKAAEEVLAASGAEGPRLLPALVSGAMAETGERYAAGGLALPLVLRSAAAAEAALAALAGIPRSAAAARGTIVLATVKGDLHDIGKNLAGLILAGSGYRVVDLGVDARVEALVAAAKREKALAVGLSALLTRSLEEMREAALALASSFASSAAGSPLLLLGGAAVTADFVATDIEPLYPNRVAACADAFAAIRFLEGKIAPPRPEGLPPAGDSPAGSAGVPPSPWKATHGASTAGCATEQIEAGLWEPPFAGAGPVEEVGLDALLGLLDRRTLFFSRWRYAADRETEAAAELEALLEAFRREGLGGARIIRGYFPCARRGLGRLLVHRRLPRGDSPGESMAFDFPAEATGRKRSLASYFPEEGGWLPLLAATAGPDLPRAAKARRADGAHDDYFRLHCLAAALTEAAAALAHGLTGEELLAAGAGCVGKRYSFGFPACPGVEAQARLLDLLDAGRAGMGLTAGDQLVPEFSVTAFIIPRADATYFTPVGPLLEVGHDE